jgi:hypothetical protein
MGQVNVSRPTPFRYLSSQVDLGLDRAARVEHIGHFKQRKFRDANACGEFQQKHHVPHGHAACY